MISGTHSKGRFQAAAPSLQIKIIIKKKKDFVGTIISNGSLDLPLGQNQPLK